MSVQSDFRSAFLLRLQSWGEFSDAQCNLLADCALAQACLESGNFTSNIYNRCNNCVGYKYYLGSKWQDPEGYTDTNGIKWGVFDDISYCANELADWIHRRKTTFASVESLDEYGNAMANKQYVTSESGSAYVSGMESYYQSTASTSEGGFDDTQPPRVVQLAGFAFSSGLVLLLLFFGLAIHIVLINRNRH